MSDYSDGDFDDEPSLSHEQFVEYGIVLSSYFSQDHEHRFLYEKFLGKGKDGVTYLIQNRPGYAATLASTRPRSHSPPQPGQQGDPETPSSSSDRPATAARQRLRGVGWDDDSRVNRIVLKIDMSVVRQFFDENYEHDDFEDNGCEKEKRYLEHLQNCQHVVELITISNDPLTRNSPSLRPHLLSESNWFFEEYLENGSLTNFIDKLIEAYKKRGSTRPRLPNRFLWSIFLCLVKMVVAMAWPNQRRDIPERCLLNRSISSIQHSDIHDGNLMFGREYHEECHTLVPILKLIDFAAAETMADDQVKKIGDEGPDPEGVYENVFAIGKTMAILMAPHLWDRLAYMVPENEQTARFFSPLMMNQIPSIAVDLINDPCAGIDLELKGLVCACLAKEPRYRPNILQLHEFVLQAADRDDTYYQSLNDQENQRRRQMNAQPQDIYDVRIETEDYIRQIIGELMLTPPSTSGNVQ